MSFIVTLFLMMVYLITLLIVIILCALPGILVIGSAIWTHQDAKKYKAANVNILDPNVWSILVLLLWLPIFPIYLIFKFAKYNQQLQNKTVNL